MTEAAAAPEPSRPAASVRSSRLLRAASRGGSRLLHYLREPERPLIAVEVRPRSIGVMRVVREGRRLALAAATSLELPAGALELSITQPNVLDPQAFAEVLRAALARAGVPAPSRIGLVLPDPAARVALVPAAEIQGKGRAGVEELIRFKLRKSVPFDIREAKVTFASSRNADSVLVAAIFHPVLDSYEQACRSAGLEPGLVEVAGLTLLQAAFGGETAGDRLLVNWDEGYVTLLLARGEWPILVRTLSGEAATAPEDVIREVANTVLYYRERLGGTGLMQVVLRSAALPPQRAAALLAQPLEKPPEILDPARGIADMGAASQALAGAAACLVGSRV